MYLPTVGTRGRRREAHLRNLDSEFCYSRMQLADLMFPVAPIIREYEYLRRECMEGRLEPVIGAMGH